jgi:hypothetical protein
MSATKSIRVVADFHTLEAYIINAIPAGRTAEGQEPAARLLRLQPDVRASDVEEAFPIRSSELRDRIALIKIFLL